MVSMWSVADHGRSDSVAEGLFHRSIERVRGEMTVHLGDIRAGMPQNRLNVPEGHAAHGQPTPGGVAEEKAEEMDVPRRTLFKWLGDLQDEGKLKRLHRGRYEKTA